MNQEKKIKIQGTEYEKESLLDFSKQSFSEESELQEESFQQTDSEVKLDEHPDKTKSRDDTQIEPDIEKLPDPILERIKELDKVIEKARQHKTEDVPIAEEHPEKPDDEILFSPVRPPPVMKSETELPNDIKPWEIDSYGRPLKDGKKHKEPTKYELWLEEQREKKGFKVKCPNCGAINIDLPNVTGEKCKECGFELDKEENIEKKMAALDRKSGKHKRGRVTGMSPTVMKLSLDLPEYLANNPNTKFSCEYRSTSYIPYLMVAIGATAAAFVEFMRAVNQNRPDDSSFVLMVIFAVVAVFAFWGLSKTMKVTKVMLNHICATFYGSGKTVEMPWEKISSITNERSLNGRAKLSNFHYGYRGYPYCFSGRWYLFSWFADSYENVSDEALDASSRSPYRTNHVTIKAGYESIDWYFSGGGDKDFVRALAIIIYMARHRNKECFVDIDSMKAADKVVEDLYSGY